MTNQDHFFGCWGADLAAAERLLSGLWAGELAKQFPAAAALLTTRPVWSTGVGKSARAADLFAEYCATLGLSVGYIAGGDLLHGGCGRVRKQCALVVFSESGRTRELVRAVELTECASVVVTASPHSPLALGANCVLAYQRPCPGEYDIPLGVLAQVLIGHALAQAIAEALQIEPSSCRKYHPANRGRLCSRTSRRPSSTLSGTRS